MAFHLEFNLDQKIWNEVGLFNDILKFEPLKISKEFSWGRNLVKKKDYKSSRWIPHFSYVISNCHNLVNFYHLEPILFSWWREGCVLHALFYVQSRKMDGGCLKYAEYYRPFHDFWSTSTSHNLLNFCRFWVVQI